MTIELNLELNTTTRVKTHFEWRKGVTDREYDLICQDDGRVVLVPVHTCPLCNDTGYMLCECEEGERRRK